MLSEILRCYSRGENRDGLIDIKFINYIPLNYFLKNSLYDMPNLLK